MSEVLDSDRTTGTNRAADGSNDAAPHAIETITNNFKQTKNNRNLAQKKREREQVVIIRRNAEGKNEINKKKIKVSKLLEEKFRRFFSASSRVCARKCRLVTKCGGE